MGADLSDQRNALITTYNSGTGLDNSRALVLRALADEIEFKRTQYNAAFVLTEYFGYLHRDPDQEGYNFWINVLNNHEQGNYRGMVCSFTTSAEYQRRFSPIVVHSNAECAGKSASDSFAEYRRPIVVHSNAECAEP
jgi:hypothetical protein